MVRARGALLFFVIFCVVGCFSPLSIFATVYFTDNFESDLTKWEYMSGSNNGVDVWKLDAGNLVSEVNRYSYSYLFAKDTYGLTDYVVNVDVMNVSGVDQHFLFRVAPDRSRFYQLELRYGDPLWPQDGNSLRLWRFSAGSYSLVVPDVYYQFIQNTWYRLKIEVKNLNIKVYINDVLVTEVNEDPTSAITTGGVGINSYAGDYFYSNVVNRYDNFVVSGGDSSVCNKIIILPGLGASWNAEALVYNQVVADDEWQMTPFVKNYDSLVGALEDKGLVLGQDFWVWNYDWRRPIAEIVTKLDDFIESVVPADEEVDLVGHSLGGLTARMWAQENVSNPRLGKVISLGSPHFGSVKAYEVWSGAKVSDGIEASSIALNILIQLHRASYPSRLETIRNLAPVIRDIVPTFDFAKKNGMVLPVVGMTEVNDYLMTKNLSVNSIFESFRAVVGMGEETKEWLNLGERSVFDRVLGWWPEGRLVSTDMGNGDGTVLAKSAKFSDDSGGWDEIASNHGSMVDGAMAEVFDELELGVGMSDGFDGNFDNHLVFYLGSPATMKVSCDDEETVSDLLGFVVIKNQNYEKCRVMLAGMANGTYHLVLGNTNNDNSWKYFEDEIGVGMSKSLIVSGNGVDLTMDVGNLDYLYNLVNRDINSLLLKYPGDVNLVGALTAVMARRDVTVTDKIFAFRKVRKESVISERILEVLKSILAINRRNTSLVMANNLVTKMTRLKDLVDYNTKVYVRRGMSPSRFGSLNYDYLNRLVDEAKVKRAGGEYGGVAANEVLVSRLYSQVW